MDNFNLKKYLAEGKLLKENVTKAYIWSHEDYYELYLTDNQGLKDATKDNEGSWVKSLLSP